MKKLADQLKAQSAFTTPISFCRGAVQAQEQRLRAMADQKAGYWWFFSGDLAGNSACPLYGRLRNERAVISWGDIRQADYISINLPGLRASVEQAFPRRSTGRMGTGTWARDGQRLHRAMEIVADTDRVAVLSWLNYDAPDYDNVSSANAAVNGAKRLNADLDRLLQRPGTRISIVGHSYGSTVAGYALRARHISGRPVPDSVVLVGSPGAGILAMQDQLIGPNTYSGVNIAAATAADRLSSLGHFTRADKCPDSRRDRIYRPVYCMPHPDQIFAIYAKDDPVTKAPFGALGTPPRASQFGAHRLQIKNKYDQKWWLQGADYFSTFENHSNYFEMVGSGSSAKPSTSLKAMAGVSVGRYSVVAWEEGTEELP